MDIWIYGCVKNILRIFQAHFRENVQNTEPGKKFNHSYKKKRVLIETKRISTKKVCLSFRLFLVLSRL